jgi:cobalamin biosynthesis protein CobT
MLPHSQMAKTQGILCCNLFILHGISLSHRRDKDEDDDDSEKDSDEDSDEDEEEEEEESEEEESEEGKSELTRAQRKEMKKKQIQAKAAAKEQEGEDGDDEDADLINPNHVQKKLTISDLNEPRKLTRRERWALLTRDYLNDHCLTLAFREQQEKKEADQRYWNVCG